MISWIINFLFLWFRKLCINILKAGPLPKHVAFIMDGSRRYAKKVNITKFESYCKGFDKAVETMEWCKALGISETTVFAFSIDNFKRSKEDLDAIFQLVNEKIVGLNNVKVKFMQQGICFRVIGNRSLLSEKYKKAMSENMLMTINNNGLFLNVAFAYTSHDEITNAIKCIVEGVNNGLLHIEDIDEQLITNCLYTNKSLDLDLLIRTSGEIRFSNFLLWQLTTAQVKFVDVFWPELTFWHLLSAVFSYQKHYHKMLNVKKFKNDLLKSKCSKRNPRVTKFLEYLEQYRMDELYNYVKIKQ